MVPERALIYYYLKMKHLITSTNIKGIQRKSLLNFVKLIDKLELDIAQGHILDYEEVLNEYKR